MRCLLVGDFPLADTFELECVILLFFNDKPSGWACIELSSDKADPTPLSNRLEALDERNDDVIEIDGEEPGGGSEATAISMFLCSRWICLLM